MQENTCRTPRRWQRHPSKIPISLLLEDVLFNSHDSAITVDISPCGASVRTKLALAPGEWLKVAAKGEFTEVMAAIVIWVRYDESSHLTSAGLEFC